MNLNEKFNIQTEKMDIYIKWHSFMVHIQLCTI